MTKAFRIYRDDRQEKEQCSFGRTHTVTYNETAVVEEVLRVKKNTYYGDIFTGIGHDTFYRDLFGNLYLSQEGWDGPSEYMRDAEGRVWSKRAAGIDANKTLDGRVINRNGEYI